MDEQGYRFGVGVLVVASIVVGVILLLFFGAAPNLLAQRYRVTINFSAAPGVATDTPVRKSGVDIGRVVDVKLLEGTRGVDLVLELDAKYQLRQDEVCRIGTDSLITNDSVVEVLPPTPETRLARFDGTGGSPLDGQLDEVEQQLASSILKNDDYIRGGLVADDPMKAFLKMEESLRPTTVAIEKAANQAASMIQEIRTVFAGSEGQIPKLTQQIEDTIKNFNETLDAIEMLFANDRLRKAIDTTADELPKLLDEAKGMFAQTKSTIAAYEGVGKTAEQAVRNITEFTEPLGEHGDEIVRDAMSTMNNLNLLLADLRRLSNRVNSSEGTIGKLIDDPQLYNQVQSSVEKFDYLAQRAGTILDDLRIFADKIARNPSQVVNLRGTLTGQIQGLGVK